MSLAVQRSATLLLAAGTAWLTSCGDPPQQPTRQMANELLQALDDAFNRSSTDYWQLFSPGPRRGRGFERMRRIVDHDNRLIQESRLVDLQELGGDSGQIGIAVTETTLACSQGGMSGDRHATYRSYIAFRDTSSGPRILLYEDVAPDPDAHIKKGVYKCPPCNFQIGDGTLDQWLIVPSPRRISGCVEMVGFYRPGEDVQLTLSVHRTSEGQLATAMLEKLISDKRDPLPAATDRSGVEAWVPPFYETEGMTVPAGMMGARCNLDLEGGRELSLYLVTRHHQAGTGYPDEVCYLLSVEASHALHETHRRDIETWLASFRLATPDQASDTVGLRSAQAHSGGKRGAQGGTYVNLRHGFACDGPREWTQTVRADRCVAGVVYECPIDESVLGVTAHDYAPGTLEDKKAHVFQMLSRPIAADGFAVVQDSGWRPGDSSTESPLLFWREIESTSTTGRRFDRILMFERLWLLVDGDIHGPDAATAYRALADSVRRL